MRMHSNHHQSPRKCYLTAGYPERRMSLKSASEHKIFYQTAGEEVSRGRMSLEPASEPQKINQSAGDPDNRMSLEPLSEPKTFYKSAFDP